MRIKFCPKCKSTEVELSIGGLTGLLECKKCGFSSPIFPEKEINETKAKKKP